MDVRSGFQRNYFIFVNEDAGYEAGQKPSGHVKLEVRDGRGRIHAAVQSLRPGNGRFDYALYLLSADSLHKAPVHAGNLVLRPGKAELEWIFDPSDVGRSGIPIEDFEVFAVIAEYSGSHENSFACPLAAYRNRRFDWRNDFRMSRMVKKPAQSEIKPIQPETKPIQPETKSMQPETKPIQPENKPIQPETNPIQPAEAKPALKFATKPAVKFESKLDPNNEAKPAFQFEIKLEAKPELENDHLSKIEHGPGAETGIETNAEPVEKPEDGPSIETQHDVYGYENDSYNIESGVEPAQTSQQAQDQQQTAQFYELSQQTAQFYGPLQQTTQFYGLDQGVTYPYQGFQNQPINAYDPFQAYTGQPSQEYTHCQAYPQQYVQSCEPEQVLGGEQVDNTGSEPSFQQEPQQEDELKQPESGVNKAEETVPQPESPLQSPEEQYMSYQMQQEEATQIQSDESAQIQEEATRTQSDDSTQMQQEEATQIQSDESAQMQQEEPAQVMQEIYTPELMEREPAEEGRQYEPQVSQDDGSDEPDNVRQTESAVTEQGGEVSQPQYQFANAAGNLNTECLYLNGNICGAFLNTAAGTASPCDACRVHRGEPAAGQVAPAGDLSRLRAILDMNFEANDPFHSKRSDYLWWKITNPVNLNNILYQNNIRSPLMFNPAVMLAHYKYRHLIMGIFTRKDGRKYVVCGVPGMHMVDRKPFGEMSKWVQAEGGRLRYGAFGYWLVYIDPDDGKILNLNQE